MNKIAEVEDARKEAFLKMIAKLPMNKRRRVELDALPLADNVHKALRSQRIKTVGELEAEIKTKKGMVRYAYILHALDIPLVPEADTAPTDSELGQLELPFQPATIPAKTFNPEAMKDIIAKLKALAEVLEEATK